MNVPLLLSIVAVFTACGSAERSAPSPPLPLAGLRRDAQSLAAKRNVVFTCQNGLAYECRVYDETGNLLRTKKRNLVDPQGVVAGSDGLLYVANEGAKNVLVYAAGGHKLLRTLDDGGNVPLDVAVFGRTVAAANQHNVTVFLAGATTPSRTLTDSNVLQGSGVAFDPSGNCYWSFASDTGGTQLDEFVGCNGSPITVPITAGSPDGLAFDGSGNLWYTSFSSLKGAGIYRCKGVGKCRIAFDQFQDAVYINFSHDFHDLWVDDRGSAALYEVDVKTGQIVEQITEGLSGSNPPVGVAAAPGPL
jgi:hypothetical protein